MSEPIDELRDLFANYAFSGKTLEEVNKLKKSELDKLDDLRDSIDQLIQRKETEARINELLGIYSVDYKAKTNVNVIRTITVEQRIVELHRRSEGGES